MMMIMMEMILAQIVKLSMRRMNLRDNVSEDMEQYELRCENVLQVVHPGDIIALFSPSNSLELFYLCKMLEVGVAQTVLTDMYNHIIPRDSQYIKVHYYEKNKQIVNSVKVDRSSSRSLKLLHTFCLPK